MQTTKTESTTQTRNVTISITAQPKLMILNGVVHSIPAGMTTAEWAQNMRSGL